VGQKVHPYGFRLGVIREHKGRWFAEGKNYRDNLVEDLKIREFILDRLEDASISDIVIERAAGTVTITIETAKPGIVIGRGGRDVDRLRRHIEGMTNYKVRVNVEETPNPDTNAQLVAETIARQIERRTSHRRAMRQAMDRAMRMGAEGVRCMVAGRLGGAEIARTEAAGPEGRVPLQTLRGDVEYGFTEAKTGYGHIGVKVWIYNGEILPPLTEEERQKRQERAEEARREAEEAKKAEAEAAREAKEAEAAEAAEEADEAAAEEAAAEDASAETEAAEAQEAEETEQSEAADAAEEAEEETDEPADDLDTDPLVAALQDDTTEDEDADEG
jgi:small subunit ribosomal protein S3